jgi:dTDP-4-dehydrorhamnose 3,5-epimerase
MKIEYLDIPGMIHIQADAFRDERGVFLETFQKNRYAAAGIRKNFVQDNLSLSRRGVLRGLHYQWPHSQGKLVQCLQGEVLDVVADIRVGSPTFGRWTSRVLSGEEASQLYIPEGCAHGFLVTSDEALFFYKCTDFYHPESERGIFWNDEDLAIDWALKGSTPILSDKDRQLPPLSAILREHLPIYEG